MEHEEKDDQVKNEENEKEPPTKGRKKRKEKKDRKERTLPMPSEPLSPAELEKKYVYSTYENIAEHFSHTRYKPWPLVEKFILSLPIGSMIADVGCGNGKYLGVNKQTFSLGSDRSANLISICKERGFESMVCDGMRLPYRSGVFDCAISIAVIHHMASPERRIQAIQELHRIVRVGGNILITVWAQEQVQLSIVYYSHVKERNKFDEQDCLVPWKLPPNFQKEEKKQEESTSDNSNFSVFQRYYHAFKKGELDELVLKIPGTKIVTSIWDHENWYLVVEKTL